MDALNNNVRRNTNQGSANLSQSPIKPNMLFDYNGSRILPNPANNSNVIPQSNEKLLFKDTINSNGA